MLSVLEWIKSFFSSVFGNFWGQLADIAMKVVMGPLAFFLFGPLFKLSGRIADYLLRKITPYLGDVGLTTESLLAWFVEVLRLQECASTLMTFLVMGLMVSLIKKVF